MERIQVTVRRIQTEAIDIKSFELTRSDRAALTAFAAGSHIDVHMANGVVRQYSLCNAPGETDRYLIAVKKEQQSRGGSQAMHSDVKEGDQLSISAPRNNFALEPSARHHVLLAGGIGVTPLLSMAEALLARGASFELHYFSRSIEHMAFHSRLSEPRFKGHVQLHYALEPDAIRTYLRKQLWHRSVDAHLYVCGPRPFMDLVESTATATWPPEAVHVEYFAADPASLAGPRDSFVVKLARSGGSYPVVANQSIVEALASHGVEIDTSCSQGVCGTCLTGVLEGEPDHRDIFLTDEERRDCDKILPCVSRAKSAVLVLDL